MMESAMLGFPWSQNSASSSECWSPSVSHGTRGASTTTELVCLIAGGVFFEMDLILLRINPLVAKSAASFLRSWNPTFHRNPAL